MRLKSVNCLFSQLRRTNGQRQFSLHKLTEQHIHLQKMCRVFAEKELKPVAAELDKKHKFPASQIKKLGKLGLLGIMADPKYGGCGENSLGLSVAVEEISRGCGGTGAIVSIHNALYVNLINSHGTEKQKEEFLVSFTCGELGCFALSEPDAGSDVGAMSTTADLDGDCYVLNGRKSWVTNGKEAKAAVVFATTDRKLKHKGISTFIVPVPTQGLSTGKAEDKMGIRASSTCDYVLENVRVPKENLIGCPIFTIIVLSKK